MTVSTSTNSVVYRGNGATTQFAVPFKVMDEGHLVVTRRNYVTGVTDYTYIGTDFTYSGIGDNAGTLTLAGAALDDDYELVIERIVPYTQDLDIVNAGGFYPETVEEQLDLIVMGIQQIADVAGRAITVPTGDTLTGLPNAAARAGMFLAFDAEGNATMASGTGADGALRADLADEDGAGLINTSLADPYAAVRSLSDKNADFYNVLDFEGVVGNDITLALENAIYHAFPSNPRLFLNIPAGVWEFSRQILVPRPVTIKGAGIAATVLQCTAQTANATMKGAFNFGLASTMAAYDPAYGTKVHGPSLFGTAGASDFSEISDLTVITEDSILDYGIWTAGRLFCANVLVFGGGFKWIAGTLQDGVGTVTGNANICTFYNCHSINASEDAFFANGSDANACSIIACNAFDPARYAYYDASFLGNSYVGCHGSGGMTTFKALYGAGTNRTNFNNCYAEAGVGTEWDVASPATITIPRGELPTSPSDSSNVTIAGLVGQGHVTGSALQFLNSLTDTGFGSSSAPAFRAFKGGWLLRGQGGNGDLFQLIAKGQGIPGTPTYGDGASLVKRDMSGPADYELMHLGDASNRPSFPRDFLLPNQRTPASATADGTKGEWCHDSSYIYICTATNTWKRVAIATW